MQEFLQQLINGLSVGSIYALIAVGYTMVYGVLQLINFAHGDVFMVGAMVALYSATGRLPANLPWWLHGVILGALVLAVIVMLILRRPVGVIGRTLAPFVILYVAFVPAMLAAAWVSRRLPQDQPSWAATGFMILSAIVACAVIGFLVERLAYRPLRDKPRINSLITAIGISLLLEFGGQHPKVFGPSPQPFPHQLVPGIHLSLFSVGDVVVSRVDALIVGVTLALMLGLTWVVLKTRTGLALRAVSYRFDTAALMGININRIISFTFVLGSSLAAVAGVLYAIKYPKVEPLMGLLPGVKAFIAAVFGGIGNIAGAVVGGVVLGLVEVLVVGYLEGGSQYRDGVAFVILIVILLVKPSGLFGKHVVEKV